MSCALAPRSAASAGTATVSAMLSMTRTSVLRQSEIRISQRRGCGFIRVGHHSGAEGAGSRR
ncbi:hypothetical protein MF672_024515 [Actinomadura sp. ATCC 31491]|uniref:Uncharacterized protein n=1 Tax=Actinomadura luzonensis TaxID=2805427 RepID=A0ABT0FYB0_9ACTN|nr:hypothetical protein [Actinomadura luzonensis]MCK2216930.1 hypothetical protein [Actinomadura luzonensis]